MTGCECDGRVLIRVRQQYGDAMTRLSELIFHYASKDGRKIESIQHVVKTCQRAGKLPTGKRGRYGGSTVSETEAVNLILALNGTDQPKDAPMEIERFRSLVPHGHRLDGGGAGPLKFVADQSNLGAALEALIASGQLIYLTMLKWVNQSFSDLDDATRAKLLHSGSVIGVDVSLTRYRVQIELWQAPTGKKKTDISVEFVADPDSLMAGFYDEQSMHRKTTVTLSFWIFYAMYLALLPEEDRPEWEGIEDFDNPPRTDLTAETA